MAEEKAIDRLRKVLQQSRYEGVDGEVIIVRARFYNALMQLLRMGKEEPQGKLIWTRKELEEYRKQTVELGGIEWPAPEPFAYVKVEAGHGVEAKEKFEQSTLVQSFNVKFPLGCHGLVSVRFRIAKNWLPLVGDNLVGDDHEFRFDEAIKVRKGTMVRVQARNSDTYDHFVGVRVDVE